MTQTFDPSAVSAHQPKGHPNDWPIADYLAVIAVYGRSSQGGRAVPSLPGWV